MIHVGLYARVIEGVLLLSAGVSKLLAFEWFISVLKKYHIFPAKLAKPIGVLIILAEVLFGVFFLWGIFLRWTVFAGVVLFVSFMLAVLTNLIRGRFDLECGCLGFRKGSKIGWHLLVRNLGFCGLAMLSLYPGIQAVSSLPVGLFALSLAFCGWSFIA